MVLLMNALILNCGSAQNKDLLGDLIRPFADGLTGAGAGVEIIDTDSMNIERCLECTADYFFESNGYCRIEDDMQIIHPKLKAADIWVFAASIDNESLYNNFKNFLDRLEPLFQMPPISINGDNYSNAGSNSTGKVVFISTSNAWGASQFNDIVKHVQNTAELFGKQYCGAITRPHASAITALEINDFPPKDIFIAARAAGKQLVQKGCIDQRHLQIISRPLVARKSFIRKISHGL